MAPAVGTNSAVKPGKKRSFVPGGAGGGRAGRLVGSGAAGVGLIRLLDYSVGPMRSRAVSGSAFLSSGVG